MSNEYEKLIQSTDKISCEEREELIKAMKKMYLDADSFDTTNITTDPNIGLSATPDLGTAPTGTLRANTLAGTWDAALYPPYPDTPESKENKKLLMDIDCVKDLEKDEYHLIIKVGLRIDKTDVHFNNRGGLSETLIKRIQKVRNNLDKLLKNKQSLIALLK